MKSTLIPITLCAFLSGIVTPAIAEPGNAYKRWAIVASTELQASGAPDLLTAELSRIAGLELVERNQLAAAVKELELSTILGAKAGADRLKLGRVLKADALLILSLDKVTQDGPAQQVTTQQGRQRNLQVVISDCRLGARLLTMNVPFAPDKAQPLVAQTASLVKRTRGRFGGGIKCLIGVTPFKSNNASHQYDYLQTGYAGVLSAALVGYDGVAVLETEEAAAIGRELELSGAELERRTVPLFVQGEFKITGTDQDPDQAVALSIEVRDGEKIRKKLEKQGPMVQVAAWLADSVARDMLQLVFKEPVKALSHDDQLKLLVERADVFAQIGAGGPAADLHQAALLLKPDDKDLHIELAADYMHLPPDDRRWEAACRQFLISLAEGTSPGPFERWRLQLALVEDLVTRGAITASEVWALLTEMELEGARVGAAVQQAKNITGRERFLPGAEFGDALDASLGRILPLYDRLQRETAVGRLHPAVKRFQSHRPPQYVQQVSDIDPRVTWRWGAVLHIMKCWDLGSTHSDKRCATLDRLHWYLTEVVGKDTQLNPMIVELVASPDLHARTTPYLRGRIPAQNWLQLYERLSRSGQEINVWYGQLGLLSHRGFGTPDAKVSTGMLEELDELSEATGKFTQRIDAQRQERSKFRFQVEQILLKLRGAILGKLQSQADGSSKPDPHDLQRPVQPWLVKPTDPDEPKVKSRIAFQPIEGVSAEWTSVLKCSDEMDLLWRVDAMFRMVKKGVVEKIYEAPSGNDNLRSVQWDGSFIWIWTADSRVSVCNRDGRPLAQFGAKEGLPEGDTILLQPLKAGSCLVVGHSSKARRAWIVHLERDPNKPQDKFKLAEIHSATKNDFQAKNPQDDDPELAFIPTGIVLYKQPRDPKRRAILVGRQIGDNYHPSSPRRPLIIDPDTLKVSLGTGNVPIHGPSSSQADSIVADGGILLFCGDELSLYAPKSNDPSGKWEMTPLEVGKLTRGSLGFEDTRPHRGLPEHIRRHLLTDHEYTLVRGIRWLRFRHADKQLELLHERPLSAEQHFRCYGLSAHYGLVAWNPTLPESPWWPADGEVCQIKIDSPAENDAAASAQRHKRHWAAVRVIEENGGSVGLVANRTAARQWGVLLDSNWTRDKKGWAALAELDNFRCLRIVRAPVNDEEMQHVARCTGLEELHFVGTRVTDKGLKYVAGLAELRSLRLEGTREGKEFSDQSLAHVSKLTHLTELALCGLGFTYSGVQQLGTLGELKLLKLYATAVPERNLADIMRQGGNGRLQVEFGPDWPEQPADLIRRIPAPTRLSLPHKVDFPPAPQEREAIAELVKLGAVLRPNSRGQVDRVAWYNAQDAGLVHLASFKELRSLELEGRGISNASMARLTPLAALELLHLQRTSITDAGVVQLARFPKLRRLYVYGSPVTETGLKALAKMNQLQYVYLGETTLAVENIEWLKKARPDLTVEPNMEDDQAVALLARQGVQLGKQADGIVRHASGIDPKRAEAQLRMLGTLPHLTHLNLSGSAVSDETLAHLKRTPHLKVLIVPGSAITDAGLDHVLQLRELEILVISGTLVTDQGLMKLVVLPKLKAVQWTNSKVTSEGAARYLQARQKQANGKGNDSDKTPRVLPAPAQPPSP